MTEAIAVYTCSNLARCIYGRLNYSETRVFLILPPCSPKTTRTPNTVFKNRCCRPHATVTCNYKSRKFPVGWCSFFYTSYLLACSPPRRCPVMSRRALTLQPTSTGCTVGLQAATWPRATTTGRRRARPCPTQAAG